MFYFVGFSVLPLTNGKILIPHILDIYVAVCSTKITATSIILVLI